MGDPYPHFCLCAFLGPYKVLKPRASAPHTKTPEIAKSLIRQTLKYNNIEHLSNLRRSLQNPIQPFRLNLWRKPYGTVQDPMRFQLHKPNKNSTGPCSKPITTYRQYRPQRKPSRFRCLPERPRSAGGLRALRHAADRLPRPHRDLETAAKTTVAFRV